MSTKVDFELEEGKTFHKRIRWYSPKHIYVPIQSINNAGPTRVVTQTAHNIPNGWACAIVSAQGLTQLNAVSIPPGKKEYRPATVIDTTTVEFNECNSSSYGLHTAGSGYLQFFEPMPLVGTLPHWVVRDKTDGAILLEADSLTGGIVINTTDYYYDIFLDVAITEALSWKKGVHELESRDPSIPFTYKVIHGKIVAVPELAT